MKALHVIEPGVLTTVQDHGRRGFSALGIGAAGALDAASADAANRLVGNRPDAAVLEVTMGGFVASAQERQLVTVTGADASITVDGVTHPTGCLIDLRPGQSLSIGVPRHGVRSYLACRGGINVPPVLGSRATDTLGGLGPGTVAAGDVIPIGEDCAQFPVIEHLCRAAASTSQPLLLHFLPGPRDHWFSLEAMTRLVTSDWTITPASNRVGIRLDGPDLGRVVDGELASEGVALGSIQVPPSGPIVFHRDHPVTGGYPVIGVVEVADLDALAQARAGDLVRFIPTADAAPRWAEIASA